MPTKTNFTAAGGAFCAAPLALILIYLLNGIFFGCWADPTAAAVACKAQLPESVDGAITAVFSGAVTLIAGHLSARGII